MLKTEILVQRQADVEPEAFHDYWRQNHAGVIRGTPDSAPLLRKYVQSHTVPEAYEDGDPPADGVAELWFDDRQAFREWFTHPYYEETVTTDEKRFIDRDAVDFFLVQATQMDFEPTGAGGDLVKLYAPLVRADGLTPAEFHRYWRYDHAATVAGTDAWEHVTHYVQNHAINEVSADESVPYDGVAEVWFEDREALEAWKEHPDQEETIWPSLEAFVDTDRSVRFTTTHEPII